MCPLDLIISLWATFGTYTIVNLYKREREREREREGERERETHTQTHRDRGGEIHR